MKFEHAALNVPDARAMMRWYVENLGLTVLRNQTEAPYTCFLADSSGRMFLELYSSPAAPVPDYAAMHPLVLHVAFVAPDARAVRKRLEGVGAKFVSENTGADGTILVMMRDPWGLTLQFCQRSKPF